MRCAPPGEYSLLVPIQVSELSSSHAKVPLSSLQQHRPDAPRPDLAPLKGLPPQNAQPGSNQEGAAGKPNQGTFYQIHGCHLHRCQGCERLTEEWSPAKGK